MRTSFVDAADLVDDDEDWHERLEALFTERGIGHG